MAQKNLKIRQLKLDLLNPRIKGAAGQQEAMQQLLDDQDAKLANLAESIVDDGLNPMDRLLVLKDADGKFIALEGNRRTLALRLLVNPAALTGLQVRPGLRRKMETLAARFDKETVEPIACYEVETRAEGTSWLDQRHRGEDEGRGIVGWSAEAIRRFTGRDPALQALDFVRQHADLTDEEKELLAGKFPLTTLDRLLQTPAVRKMLGLVIQDDKLLTGLPATEALKPLKRIVLDLAGKKTNVTKLKTVKQQTDYIEKFDSTDLPDMSRDGPNLQAVESIDESQFSPPPPPKPRKARAPQKLPERVAVVPAACRLNVTNNKTQEIYGELLNLRLKQFPHAIAVLLRVFMENSVDHYLDANQISLKFTPPGASRDRFKSLDVKVKDAISHMVAAGADPANFDGVKRALSDSNHPLSIDLQHAYVHNRYVTPSERDLVVAWDNAQAFFEKIWP